MSSKSLSGIPKKRLRSEQKIFLVGECESVILGAKLPSMKQVLQLLFYKMRHENLTLESSMKYTIGATIEFWKKAKIPTAQEKNCIKKLKNLYEEWRNLQKHSKTPNEKCRKNEAEFKDKIENFIFDIAAMDALGIMKMQEDKDFLLLQRNRGRPGSMYGADTVLTRKEKRKDQRMEEERKRVEKHLVHSKFIKVKLYWFFFLIFDPI